MRCISIALLSLALLAPLSAHAQSREGICADVRLGMAKPAVAEWTYWLGAGGGWGALGNLNERAIVDLRLGGGVDFSIAREGSERHYGGPLEVRLGPWIQAATSIDDVVLEGGAMLDIGQTAHAQWGTFGMRVGIGTRGDAQGFRVAGSLTLTYGVRYAPERYSDGGGCVEEDGLHIVDAGREVQDHGFVTGIRLFGTARVDAENVYSLVFGVELEPTFFFPPYESQGRWIGAR